jgi:hypothetical protein
LTACPRRGRSWPCHPPWPPTAVALAVVGSSRERPGHPDRVRLRCPKSFAPSDCSGRTSWWGTSGRTLGYVLVVRPVITGTSAASCHNLPGTKAIRGAHFRLGHRAPGRGGRQARTVSGCLNSAFLGLFSTSCGPSFLAMDTQLGARQDGGPQRAWGVRRGAWGGRTVASEAEGTEITLHASRLTPHAYRLETRTERNKFATTAVGVKGRSRPTLQHATLGPLKR